MNKNRINQSAPKVSVIMPVYNREKYIVESVKSILNQKFQDFELIIIDDSSTDFTLPLLKSFTDKRIKLILNTNNMGNYFSRNKGMDYATGKYICVMDSDDIALPNRLQKQYDFMEKNQHFGLCGSFVQVLDSAEIITAPEDYEEIKVWSMSNIMFRHPTVFIRREFLAKYNLKYDESYRYAGDYDFLVKAALLFPVTNIQEVLLKYRRHPDQISSAQKSGQFEIVGEVILKQLRILKEDATPNEKKLHLSLMHRFPVKEVVEFESLKQWANYLLELNHNKCIYDSIHLANFFKSLLKYIFKKYRLALCESIYSNAEIGKINEFLEPGLPLVFQKEWTVLPDFTLNFMNIIFQSKPSVVVECGSGLSTIILGYLAKKRNIQKCYSLENNKQFYDFTKDEIIKHGLEEYVSLLYAPLKKISIDEKEWLWYDMELINSKIKQIDVLLVDGPPGQIQKNSRYPALHMLKKFLHNKTIIVIDDSKREDERAIINQWLIENPDYEVDYHDTLKGMAIITKSKA